MPPPITAGAQELAHARAKNHPRSRDSPKVNLASVAAAHGAIGFKLHLSARRMRAADIAILLRHNISNRRRTVHDDEP